MEPCPIGIKPASNTHRYSAGAKLSGLSPDSISMLWAAVALSLRFAKRLATLGFHFYRDI